MAGFDQTLKWTFGLINSANKYLTAEKFQSKVACNGNSLKKKQIWTMERVSDDVVALKSCFGKYLTADKDGKLDGSGEDIGNDQKFSLETQEDGRVAIKSATHGRYIGGSGDNLSAFDKSISPSSLFHVQLAMHPQINLRNVNRKTYVHLQEGELRCNEQVPWGYDAMIILEFHEGKYALRAANAKYLARTGALQNDLTPDSLYTLVFKGVNVAFKDNGGKYLTAVGIKATIQSRKSNIGKDEQFVIEDSHPQARLVANNGKYVSLSGNEVRANQGKASDTEIFQMEATDRTDRSGNVKWAFLSNTAKYWDSGHTITASADNFSAETCKFSVEWMGTMIAIKASNGKYISITTNGQMSAKSAEVDDSCKFVFEFINRPILVLRGENGFIGAKGQSGILECNRSQYDVFAVECEAGKYHIKSAAGKFWKVEADNTLTVNADGPTPFLFELCAHTHMLIKAPNGKYLEGEQNGSFKASGSGISAKTLLEY